jgi:hypothetical protein
VRTLPAAELVPLLLPVARSGLEGAGVLPEEVGELLAVVEARAAGGQTGAVWQRQTLAALAPRLGRERALAAMLERYLDHQLDGQPVHTWPVPAAVSGGARPAGAAGRPARPGPGRRPPPRREAAP